MMIWHEDDDSNDDNDDAGGCVPALTTCVLAV